MKKVNVVLGVTGSVAAFKAAELASAMVKKGYDIHVIMTDAATKFIAPLTFQSLTKHKVYTNMFDEIVYEDVRHISLASRADVLVIAPATANIIGKIAGGIADDMLSTVVMATTSPILICPAMNTAMYENPIVQQNIQKLTSLGYYFVEPKESRLACGDVGRGAMADVERIAEVISQILGEREFVSPTPQTAPEFAQYSLSEVGEHLKNPQVVALFERVEDILGKLLKDSERQMYLSFYDDLGLSVDLIGFLLEFCLERGKKANNYIRTVAENWANQGFTTVAEAADYVSLYNNEYREILRFFGISSRDPIEKEIKYMRRWLKEDNFSMELIKAACEKTIINRAAANFPYADGILNKWLKENIKTVSEIENLEKEYYDNVKPRPFKATEGKGGKKFQNYEGRKWDYEKLAQMERDYVAQKAAE